MPKFPDEFDYSEKFCDFFYEYRHVLLTKDAFLKINELFKKEQKGQRVLTEQEWRSLGIQQSAGWENYTTLPNEPNVLLFRRPKGTNPRTGQKPADYEAKLADYLKMRKNYYSYEADLDAE